MKSWKEVPHLFCNGKFKVQTNLEDIPDNKILVGCIGEEKNLLLDDGNFIDSQNTQLIARPISDMSDEEERGLHWDYDRVINDPEENLDIFNFLYLLSIGVYPFDQSHFESGEVIARYENGDNDE